MIERSFLGIDIGSYSVKIVEYSRGLRDGRFTRCVEVPLSRDAALEQISELTAGALEEGGFSLDCAVAAVPSARITQRHFRLPFTGKQVTGAVRYEVEESLPVPLDGMILTHQPAAVRPGQTDVLAILTPQGEVEQRLELARACGFDPRHLEVEGAVLANLTGALGLGPAARVFLDIGHSKTHVCLVVGGKPLLLRRIPVAGHQLTEALSEELSLPYLEAEAYKQRHGIFKAGSTTPASLRVGVLLEQLVREALRTLQSLVSDAAGPEAPTEVVLVGGSSATPGLCEYFSERLGLPARVLEVDPGDPAQELGARAAVFAQAAALALRGSSAERSTQLDLRQGELRYVPDLSALRPQLQWTALLIALLLVLWPVSLAAQFWSTSHTVSRQREAIADAQRQLMPEVPVAPDPMTSFTAGYEQTVGLADHLGVTGNGASPLEILRMIHEAIPEALEVSFSEMTINRREITARGFAPGTSTTNQVQSLLEQIDIFENVTMGLQRVEGRGGRPAGFSFKLEIKLAS